MRKEEILEILADWNFWAKEIGVGIERERYVKELLTLITKTDQIVCISGVRRAGKSTLIKQIARELAKTAGARNTLVVNFEDERFYGRDLAILRQIYEAYLEKVHPDKRPFIFLDEIQAIEGWERFVRGLHERGEARLAISGSSARLLSEEFATLLTGRHVTLAVYPLNFTEFLKFKGLEIKSEVEALAKRMGIRRLLDEYLEFGGFPEVVLSQEKRRILLSYFEATITRDVAERFKIREREKLRTLAKYYLTDISSPMTFNSVSRFLELPLTTVERFSSHLETANLIFFVKRFSYSLKEQEKSPRKVYSIDIGLSNAIGFKFAKNMGKTAENVVATSLKVWQSFDPEVEVYYWKDSLGREVDFVVKKGLKAEQLIQVCWDVSELETRDRELRSLVGAMKKLKVDEGTVVTGDHEGEEKIRGKKIHYIPLWKWLVVGR
jgi:predicted AAA+ superfamily ATPase